MSDEKTESLQPDEVPLPSKKKGNWIGLICKITFFVAAFLLIIFTVMANIGGKSDTLKQSIEEYINENTPYQATIAQLNGMTFFPDISFDFEGAELYNKKTLDLAVTIQKLQAAFGFWDVMGSTGKIKALNVENFWAGESTLLRAPLQIDGMKIMDLEDGPVFAGKGSINDARFDFSARMDSKGTGRGKRYFFGYERDFKMRLGELDLQGKVRNGKSSGITVENLEISQEGNKVMTGRFSVVRNGPVLTFTADLEMAEHGSKISPVIDLNLPLGGNPMQINGKVESPAFHAEDFSAGSAYDKMITDLEKIFMTGENPVTPELTIDTDTAAGPVPMKGWHVETQKLKKSE